MAASDLPLLHEWLNREHVARWWRERSTLQEVSDHYLPAIEGSDPTDHYLIVLAGREIGFIQTYLVSDYAEYAALLEVGDGVAGLDLLLADEESTGRGLGTEVIRAFVRDVVFAAALVVSLAAAAAAGAAPITQAPPFGSPRRTCARAG